MIGLNLRSEKGTLINVNGESGKWLYGIKDITANSNSEIEIVISAYDPDVRHKIQGPQSIEGKFYYTSELPFDVHGDINLPGICKLKGVYISSMAWDAWRFEYEYNFVAREVEYENPMNIENTLVNTLDFEF
jgi:hypothetical protein